jgi:hypothetical protein
MIGKMAKMRRALIDFAEATSLLLRLIFIKKKFLG